MRQLLQRISPDRRRAVVVTLIFIAALFGIWRRLTRSEHNPAEQCWLPGFPRYPHSKLTHVNHAGKAWHASLDTPDSSERVAAYYREHLEAVETTQRERVGRFHWTDLRGEHPAGSYISVSIMEDHPEDADVKLLRRIDMETSINIMVMPPEHAKNDPTWPFGPDHREDDDLSTTVEKFLVDLLIDGDDEEDEENQL